MKSEKDEMIIREDNICPMKNLPCDDECCSVGAVCNLYASILIGSTNVDEQKKTLQSEDNAALNAVKSKFTKNRTHHPRTIKSEK